MSIQITSTTSHIVITNGANVRNINKQVIREISILKGTTVKIDIGGGALRNIFLPVADITVPEHLDAPALLVALNNMLIPLEIELEHDLTALSETLNSMTEQIANILPASMQEPSLIDEARENVIYTGFADPHTDTSEARWAIMRTTIENDIITNHWAGGSQAMASVWDNRAALSYA